MADGSGMELYDATFRLYDPQIGRFWQADPLSDFNTRFSPYSFSNNNPISINDPHGLLSDSLNRHVLPTVYVTAKRKPKLRGFNWPSYTKEEVSRWREEKYRYNLRRDAGAAVIQGGESFLYLDNVSSFERRYQAREDGRKMQIGAVCAMATPVAAAAIVETVGVAPILSQVSTELGLIRTGAVMVGKKYGSALIGAAAINAAQNGSLAKIDAFDVALNTLFSANNVLNLIGNSILGAAVDYTVGTGLQVVGDGKSIGAAGIDLTFSMLGNGLQYTFGGGSTPVNMFTDIVSGKASNLTTAQADKK